jgi:hypothetical protein
MLCVRSFTVSRHRPAETLLRDTPFFLTLYLPDPHHPYDAHRFDIPDFGEGDLGRYV